MTSPHDILISARDAKALGSMLSDWPRRHRLEEQAANTLADMLAGAHVVAPDRLPDGVVTMDSTVTYVETPGGPCRAVTIVHPAQADAGAGRVSVLSPIGRALLGRPTGSVTEVMLPTGRRLALQIVDVFGSSVEEEQALAYA